MCACMHVCMRVCKHHVHVHILSPMHVNLLEYYELQLTFLSSMIVLQPPLLCEGWGGRPLCLSGKTSVLMELPRSCDCTAQRNILSIGSVSPALM